MVLSGCHFGPCVPEDPAAPGRESQLPPPRAFPAVPLVARSMGQASGRDLTCVALDSAEVK